MKILMSPCVGNLDEKIHYIFEGEKIIVRQFGITDEFDFTLMPEGELPINYEKNQTMVETILSVNPIVSAKRENGQLFLELLNIIESDATEEEKFPKWIEV